MKCPLGEERSGEIPPLLYWWVDKKHPTATVEGGRRRHAGRVLDFTTTVSSNLKLLLIGDSVMIQLAQAFDEALGVAMSYKADTSFGKHGRGMMAVRLLDQHVVEEYQQHGA